MSRLRDALITITKAVQGNFDHLQGQARDFANQFNRLAADLEQVQSILGIPLDARPSNSTDDGGNVPGIDPSHIGGGGSPIIVQDHDELGGVRQAQHHEVMPPGYGDEGEEGPPGPPGPAGADGAAGATGATGAAGATGPAGADGQVGPPGHDGEEGDFSYPPPVQVTSESASDETPGPVAYLKLAYAKYYNSATQTGVVTATDTDVTGFDTKAFDTLGIGSPTSGVFTIPDNGVYMVFGSVGFDANSTGKRDVYLQHGVSAVYTKFGGTSELGASTTANVIPFAGMDYFRTGDTVKVTVNQTSGANRTLSSGLANTEVCFARMATRDQVVLEGVSATDPTTTALSNVAAKIGTSKETFRPGRLGYDLQDVSGTFGDGISGVGGLAGPWLAGVFDTLKTANDKLILQLGGSTAYPGTAITSNPQAYKTAKTSAQTPLSDLAFCVAGQGSMAWWQKISGSTAVQDGTKTRLWFAALGVRRLYSRFFFSQSNGQATAGGGFTDLIFGADTAGRGMALDTGVGTSDEFTLNTGGDCTTITLPKTGRYIVFVHQNQGTATNRVGLRVLQNGATTVCQYFGASANATGYEDIECYGIIDGASGDTIKVQWSVTTNNSSPGASSKESVFFLYLD